MMNTKDYTGKPSVDRPWRKYYPDEMLNMEIPECSVLEYLKQNCPGNDIPALHFYGQNITWDTIFQMVEPIAKGLKALGFGEGDQIPVFLRATPEFIYLLLAIEKIGASMLCRDNTLEENIEAVQNAGAKVIFVHDYLKESEVERYLSECGLEKIVFIDPCYSCVREDLPDYIKNNLENDYHLSYTPPAQVIDWDTFIEMGKDCEDSIEVPADINRPLFRAYTSGSTGPSKQVIHSAKTIIGIVHQMNFYGGSSEFRPTWLLTCLPTALVAVVVSGIIMPLSSNKLLILDPFCDPDDVDLEFMRYRPNSWVMIPMFVETLMRNGRIPDDYDMSHLLAAGVGCEAFNNNQMKRGQKFLKDHNCDIRLNTGYGSSEAGSNMTLPMTPHRMGDGNVGIPMPLNTISIFKVGTQEECGYYEIGEICKAGPGNMLGYDDPEETARTLQRHQDGQIWLHTGDFGYMNEDGVLYTLTRGFSPRYGGGDLAVLPMENRIADAEIEGIDDEFFVVVPDPEHEGYFLPYLYVVLEEGYSMEDVEEPIRECLESFMEPVQIIELPERPFFHFKTNRIGLSQTLIMARFDQNEKKDGKNIVGK